MFTLPVQMVEETCPRQELFEELFEHLDIAAANGRHAVVSATVAEPIFCAGEILCVTGDPGFGITSVVASFAQYYIDAMQNMSKQKARRVFVLVALLHFGACHNLLSMLTTRHFRCFGSCTLLATAPVHPPICVACLCGNGTRPYLLTTLTSLIPPNETWTNLYKCLL